MPEVIGVTTNPETGETIPVTATESSPGSAESSPGSVQLIKLKESFTWRIKASVGESVDDLRSAKEAVVAIARELEGDIQGLTQRPLTDPSESF
jgi:hypothetical protein